MPAPLALTNLPVDALEPNPWNPNRMDDVMRAKLRAYLEAEGLVQPLVVRPHPEAPDRCQILGGFHRWTICKDDLGYTTVPCVVLDLDDRRAKVLTVNLNELGGDPVPHLMAELLHDLSRDATLHDLATLLPYDERELHDTLDLLKVPAGLELDLEAEVRAHRDGSPTMMTFLVDEAAVVEEALAAIVPTLEGKNRRGRALVLLAREHLARMQPTTPSAEPQAAAG